MPTRNTESQVNDTTSTPPKKRSVKEDGVSSDADEKIKNLPGVTAKRSGSGKKKTHQFQLGADFKEGMQTFCDVLSRTEAAKMENTRELEKQKLLMQRELEKDRKEFQLQTSLQFAKILVKNKTRKVTASSSTYVESDSD
ncbi:hypothetical protein R1flu_026751 [Riccia fluitans]|uniref:No apical meristem-associated C-terminal domain-containing protein n=1 Tax=Riccia fluitans TaxID=41844 RepID=A0ABD1XHK3_9MARC